MDRTVTIGTLVDACCNDVPAIWMAFNADWRMPASTRTMVGLGCAALPAGGAPAGGVPVGGVLAGVKDGAGAGAAAGIVELGVGGGAGPTKG